MRNAIMTLILAIVVLLLVFAAGCSQMEKGKVVSKMYYPASTYTTMMCGSYSTQGMCNVWIPQTNFVPESWEFFLRDGDEEGYRTVSEEEYNSYKVGQQYP
jgi:hypothetical protein